MRRLVTLTWTTLDQGLTSIVSLGLVILAANAFSPSSFGTFTLVQAVLIAVSSAYRITIGTIVLTSSAPRAYPTPSALWVIPSVWIAFAIAGALAHWASRSDLSLALTGAGLYLFAGTSSTTSRFLAYGEGRTSHASFFALLNALGLIPAALGNFSHWSEMLFAFGGMSALAVGLFSRSLPSMRTFLRDWRASVTTIRFRRRELYALSGSFVGAHGVALLVPFVVASVLGPQSVAGLRGAQTLTTAGTQVSQGVQPMVLAKSHKAYRAGHFRLPRVFKYWILVLAVSMAVVGSVLMLIPDRIGGLLLGETWGIARVLLVYLVVEAVAAQLAAGLEGQMRAVGATGLATRIRLVMAFPTLVALFLTASFGGIREAAASLAASGLILCGLLWVGLNRVLRDRSTG